MKRHHITTEAELAAARAESLADDQAGLLDIGSETWGVTQAGVPGQMSRFSDGCGAVTLPDQEDSLYGRWEEGRLYLDEGFVVYDETGAEA